jgi:hypothetical protein
MGEPVNLVLIGALGQALLLPFLGMAALYFRYRRTEVRLRSSSWGAICLWIAALSMTAAGVYQLVDKMAPKLTPSTPPAREFVPASTNSFPR